MRTAGIGGLLMSWRRSTTLLDLYEEWGSCTSLHGARASAPLGTLSPENTGPDRQPEPS